MKKSPLIMLLAAADLLVFVLIAYPATDILIRSISGRLSTRIWIPIPIAALLILMSGILTLKRGSWRWAVAGLVIGVATGVYFVYLLFLGAMGY
jgi:glucan phosphoethanolaminetransferase (alkaline phosphatase superfamily)